MPQVQAPMVRQPESPQEAPMVYTPPPCINPDWGVTAVRVMTGLLFAVHGYQKFAGGIGGVSAYFTKVAIPLPGCDGSLHRRP